MGNQSYWGASSAFICYVTLVAGIFGSSIIVALIFVGLGVDFQNLSFPSSLISIPLTEGTILAITLFFAKEKRATLQKLGLKKPSLKIILIVSAVAVLLIFLAGILSLFEETFFGPDPMANELLTALLPHNIFQLMLLVGLSLFLVGPAEELAFRGFIQRGLGTSFGEFPSLIIASVMFGLLHGLNSIRSVIPVTVVSLILGYIWQKTDGNTTACAWMHGLYDAITMALVYFASFSI
jgi:membrane protease YdiL (CAAX protease family)